MTTSATFPIEITASDKTAKGRKAAEKNLGAIPKHVSAVNKRYADEADRSVRRSSRGLIRTFGQVEQASAKIFGGRSITSGLSTRLGALREAAAATGEGLGEAATAGSALSGAIGAVGVAAGAAVGVLAAAAYGAFKLADGWAKGAASIGRTADIIGVATKSLQEFNAAAERQGVDKGTATSAVGGLSQTLNDARYGRNNDAVALLSRLGVQIKLNKDGTVDTGAMLPAVADALSRQNSSGRRTAARILGIPEAALPAFTQGGKALSADMRDADTTAYVATPGDIETAKRIQRKEAIAGQITDKDIAVAGAATATVGERAADATIAAGRQIVSSVQNLGSVVRQNFTPAVKTFENATTKFASSIMDLVVPAAQAAQRKYGVPASISLGQFGLESSWGKRMPKGSNNPFGIKARAGEPFVLARTREERPDGSSYYTMAKFRKFDTLDDAFEAHARLLQGRRYSRARAASSVDEYADALTGTYATDHRYGQKLKSTIHGRDLTQYDHGEIPVKVEVHLVNAPAGTKVKATAGRQKPAVSHAMQH